MFDHIHPAQDNPAGLVVIGERIAVELTRPNQYAKRILKGRRTGRVDILDWNRLRVLVGDRILGKSRGDGSDRGQGSKDRARFQERVE
jgi:hypothetical protein